MNNRAPRIGIEVKLSLFTAGIAVYLEKSKTANENTNIIFKIQ